MWCMRNWGSVRLGIWHSEIFSKVWSLLIMETWWVQCVLKGTINIQDKCCNSSVYHHLNTNSVISLQLRENLLKKWCAIPSIPRHTKPVLVFGWWWWKALSNTSVQNRSSELSVKVIVYDFIIFILIKHNVSKVLLCSRMTILRSHWIETSALSSWNTATP